MTYWMSDILDILNQKVFHGMYLRVHWELYTVPVFSVENPLAQFVQFLFPGAALNEPRGHLTQVLFNDGR